MCAPNPTIVLSDIILLIQSEIRREMLGELISLYYTTFLVSIRSLNIPDDIFSMEELFVEVEDHIV